ncbi:MAG: ribosome-associated translation inhibitor RaiA [Clostridiales bacterium]|jgi:putative sigma-54 modulation protein|nr:ribosome-associated translation inhibitor RaiA [Clostridiales bacterium]
MRYSFTGKGLTVGETLREKTINKIGRLEKLLHEDAEVFVTFSVVKLEHKVEVTIPLSRGILRAEVIDAELQTALDQVIDILEKQMVRYKERLSRKAKVDPNFKEELKSYFSVDEEDDQPEHGEKEGIVIKKSKKFALKPMDAEEAIMNMELLGHNFFVFMNAETEEVNVVYRRHDNAYGLIEPEF